MKINIQLIIIVILLVLCLILSYILINEEGERTLCQRMLDIDTCTHQAETCADDCGINDTARSDACLAECENSFNKCLGN